MRTSRVEGRTRQRVVGSLGRLDNLLETGAIDSMVASLAKFSDTCAVLMPMKGVDLTVTETREITPALVFGRI